MQLIPRYLVNNKVFIIANDTGFPVEYRPVYSRQLKVYRGIDNALQFRLLNADQKPVRITGTPMFIAFGDQDTKLIELECTVQDDGSSTASKGMFTVTISEEALLNIKDQYLSYTVHIDNGTNVLTYTDRDFNAAGTIKVDGTAYPGPKSSTQIVNFKEENNKWYAGSDDTNKIDAQPGLNGNEALHTAAIYTNGYIGNITIQATLDNQITGLNNWSTISTIAFDGTEVEPIAANFTGVFSFIRFELDADPTSKVEKILVRN